MGGGTSEVMLASRPSRGSRAELRSCREGQLCPSGPLTGVSVTKRHFVSCFLSGFLTEFNFTQDSSGLTPFKSREPSSRIGKIQVIILDLKPSLPACGTYETCGFSDIPAALKPSLISSLPASYPPPLPSPCFSCAAL